MPRKPSTSSLIVIGSLLIGNAAQAAGGDPHSYANIQDFRTRELAIELTVDFDKKQLRGEADLQLQRLNPKARQLVLDTRDLDIEAVEAGSGSTLKSAAFKLAKADPILGSALSIELPASADRVRIRYATRPSASGLQWLAPAQTAGGKLPFLFTQSQAIHARSWIPLQDTPSVRAPYRARIHTPKELRAVMSADNDPKAAQDGDYTFSMPQPIPSYLIALAVGDLQFRELGARTGVYAEPATIEAAAKEFDDTEQMLVRCEAVFGPYRWGRYDLLILPPSFPYGGMENPRLTFATPTVIAGDKSLVSLVAHELAHSWSGNLVTNAVWGDFWLNEGFTNHLTFRIMEEVYGKDVTQQERVLDATELKQTLERLDNDGDKTLVPDLAGRDPDDGVTDVPYARGALFLAYLEARFTRPVFDQFLRGWFDSHAFQSVRTEDFLKYLHAELLDKKPGVVSEAELNAWLRVPAMPADTIWPQSDAFAKVDAQRAAWQAGTRKAVKLDTKGWDTRQWVHFLDALPPLKSQQLAELDQAFAFSKTGNAIIASQWWQLCAKSHYAAADAGIGAYLGQVGRMKLIVPIYRELAKTAQGRAQAQALFERWRERYHPIAQDAIAKVIKG